MERYCGFLKGALRSKKSPWANLNNITLHRPYLEQLDARYDFAEEFSSAQHRTEGLSSSEEKYTECGRSTFNPISFLIHSPVDPQAILRTPCNRNHCPDLPMRHKIAIYFRNVSASQEISPPREEISPPREEKENNLLKSPSFPPPHSNKEHITVTTKCMILPTLLQFAYHFIGWPKQRSSHQGKGIDIGRFPTGEWFSPHIHSLDESQRASGSKSKSKSYSEKKLDITASNLL
jgi:hypothetical protein